MIKALAAGNLVFALLASIFWGLWNSEKVKTTALQDNVDDLKTAVDEWKGRSDTKDTLLTENNKNLIDTLSEINTAREETSDAQRTIADLRNQLEDQAREDPLRTGNLSTERFNCGLQRIAGNDCPGPSDDSK